MNKKEREKYDDPTVKFAVIDDDDEYDRCPKGDKEDRLKCLYCGENADASAHQYPLYDRPDGMEPGHPFTPCVIMAQYRKSPYGGCDV